MLLIVLTVGVLSLFLVGGTSNKLVYIEGRPWNYPKLIAPFDIPIEYDQVTKDRITDSVNANFVHFYKLDNQLGEQKLMQLNKALSNQPSLPVGVRQHVLTLLERIYDDGIINTEAFEQIEAGKMQHVSISDGSAQRVVIATDHMHSVK